MHKIKIIFPGGCYGNFLASCIMGFTDFDAGFTLGVSPSGSAHYVRSNIKFKSQIFVLHDRDYKRSSGEKIIEIVPGSHNALGYFDNQLTKEYNFDIKKHLQSLNSNFGTNHEKWELRELISLTIDSWLQASYKQYANGKYFCGESDASLIADNLVGANNVNYISSALKDLGFTITDKDGLVMFCEEYVKSQTFLNHETKCCEWVDAIISGTEMASPCKTILDEAYVQAKLRSKGFEINCFGLSDFPKTSTELLTLLRRFAD